MRYLTLLRWRIVGKICQKSIETWPNVGRHPGISYYHYYHLDLEFSLGCCTPLRRPHPGMIRCCFVDILSHVNHRYNSELCTERDKCIFCLSIMMWWCYNNYAPAILSSTDTYQYKTWEYWWHIKHMYAQVNCRKQHRNLPKEGKFKLFPWLYHTGKITGQ